LRYAFLRKDLEGFHPIAAVAGKARLTAGTIGSKKELSGV